MTEPVRNVSCELVLDVLDPVRLDLQVALADSGPSVEESLRITVDGQQVEHTEVLVTGEGRVQVCALPVGEVSISYHAKVVGRAAPAVVTAADRVIYLRPSRYAESDRLSPIAQAEFAGITEPSDLLAAVSSWVGTRVAYVAGSSEPTDGAVDTLLKRQGVCRDYAHLVIALLRAVDVPARLAAVYAPGLDPMDFHAVAEVAVDDVWRVVDATLLAPRSSLVRICAGRDAADTAFISTYGGRAELVELTVTATIDGDLPTDDISQLASIT